MIWPRSSGKTGRPSRVGFRHPGQAIAVGFASAVVVGTLLLSSPMASSSGRRAPLEDALFTATSAVCVTGLVTVDTGTYWSGFGRAVILILIQAGGLGIMTLATLLAILLSRRLGVRAQLVVQAETKTLNAADIRRVIRNVVLFSLICELITAVILAIRFRLAYEETFGAAVYRGVFHAISAFNNAGFSTHPDSLIRYASDGWICMTITVAVIVGGLGFPVWFELARSWRRPKDWTVLTRITVLTTGRSCQWEPSWLYRRNSGTLTPSARYQAGGGC
jgi:trk system potassium uptake protein TrkH